jgi:PAS domain S-box-containing protein
MHVVFRGGIFVVLVFFLVCATYLAATIHKRQRALATTSHYSIVWASARMAADLNRFGQALAEFAVPGTQADIEKVQMRAGIMKNRLNVMSHGEFLEFTKAVPSQRKNLLAITTAMDGIWKELDDLKADSVPDLLEELSAVQTKASEIVSASREFSADQEQAETTELLYLHVAFATIVAFLILFGCIMLLTVNRQNRRIKLSHDQLREMTDNLRRTSVSRQCLDAAINNMSQALCMVDASNLIIIWNEQFTGMFGIPSEVMTRGATFTEALSENNVRREIAASVSDMCDALQASIAGGRAGRMVQEFGNGQVIEISHRPMQGGWVATFEDITDRRQAEAERMRALAEAELAQGREQAAEAANRAKSSFLAVMSHEIRTPMNAVLGLASTLLEDELTGDQQASVKGIHDAADDLLNILNDILDYSKLEAGRLVLEVTPFSPAAIVDQAMSLVGPRAAAKSLALRTTIAPDVPETLAGDAGRIRQVLINLVGNAVKFTAKGEIAIGVRLLGQQDGRATLEWTVSDTGIGIPAERIGALFTEFMQADSSITRRFGGTGLGLAICKRIIEQMGGEVSVSSVLGQGSTFRFTVALPLADAAGPAESDDAKVYDAFRAHIAALGRPLRLLITDDNTTNRMIAARMLKDFDVQPLMACNGVEALDSANRFPLDIILMDMRMPEMDGLEATVALRAMGGRFANLPVVAFTANAFPDDLNACRDAGMNGFVSKPVRKRKLVEIILETLTGAAMWSPGIAPDQDPTGPDHRDQPAPAKSGNAAVREGLLVRA